MEHPHCNCPLTNCHLRNTKACEQCPWDYSEEAQLAAHKHVAQALNDSINRDNSPDTLFGLVTVPSKRPNRAYPIDEIDIGLIKKIKCPEDIV